jgi:hypothetical protein
VVQELELQHQELPQVLLEQQELQHMVQDLELEPADMVQLELEPHMEAALNQVLLMDNHQAVFHHL